MLRYFALYVTLILLASKAHADPLGVQYDFSKLEQAKARIRAAQERARAARVIHLDPVVIHIDDPMPTIEDKGAEYDELHCKAYARGKRAVQFNFSEAQGMVIKGRKGNDDAEARQIMKNLHHALEQIQ